MSRSWPSSALPWPTGSASVSSHKLTPKRISWTDQAKADVRAIEQPIALQILKTLGRYVLTGEGRIRQLKGIEPPLLRLLAQSRRVFFRDHGDYLEIARVLDRKEAYRRGRAWEAGAARMAAPLGTAFTGRIPPFRPTCNVVAEKH